MRRTDGRGARTPVPGERSETPSESSSPFVVIGLLQFVRAQLCRPRRDEGIVASDETSRYTPSDRGALVRARVASMSCSPVCWRRAGAPRRFGGVFIAARAAASSSCASVLGEETRAVARSRRRAAPRSETTRRVARHHARVLPPRGERVATSSPPARWRPFLSRGDRRARPRALPRRVRFQQLVDAFLWYDHAHAAGGLAACDLTNRIATRAGLAIICLEPLAAMLAAHVVADKKPHPAVVAAYLGIFIFTPLCGTSLLPTARRARTSPRSISSTGRSISPRRRRGGYESTPAAERPEPLPPLPRAAIGPTGYTS